MMDAIRSATSRVGDSDHRQHGGGRTEITGNSLKCLSLTYLPRLRIIIVTGRATTSKVVRFRLCGLEINRENVVRFRSCE